MRTLRPRAKRIAALLRRKGARLVLAESCTGGLVAAVLTEIPGVSDVFCGSHVVYREASKRAWIGVSARDLKRHSAVSAEVAEEMVRGALRKTPEATVAGAVTGYLGPAGEKVGLVYLSVMARGMRAPITTELRIGKIGGAPRIARLRRREMAAKKLLIAIATLLNSNGRTGKRSRV